MGTIRAIDELVARVHSLGMKSAQLDRPDWDTYFMNIADVVATRGNCIRRQVAAVVVKDRRLVTTGYNGTPKGVPNCCDGGCTRCAGDAAPGKDLGECICSHAEENAITQAAYHGMSLRGAVLYTTLNPCLICAKLIISAGIKEVVYRDDYEFDAQTRILFDQAGVACRKIE